MEKNVPTILKSLLQSCQLLGKDYPILANSTINQKLNINPTFGLDPGEKPVAKYFCIGNGGIKSSTGPDNFPFAQSFCHKPTDTGLFREIPFLMRPINADIGEITRANYRLRRVVTVGAQQYYAYYGKVVNVADSTSVLQKRVVENDGSVTSTNHTPANGDLNPVPVIPVANNTILTTNKYVAASTKITLSLDANDIAEIVNGCQLLFGSGDLAVISEIAYCSGVDRTIGNMTEGVCIQVMNFLATYFPANAISQGINYTFDVGNTEPLLELV